MNKKYVLTAVGIIIALIIPVGGWAFTRRLMDAEHNRLLAGVTYFYAETPARDSSAAATQENEIHIAVNSELLEQRGKLQDGMVMIPFHAIAYALGETPAAQPEFTTVRELVDYFGTDISWNADTQTIYIMCVD
ncbi:MAG: hypothetical protein FWB96_04175 [Defluviitaleaceae bacterium]|nr:hypothetical protein [Defluviitaleaceae bacterium]MCL2263135.1 hypothetical protein [Defluviitaleaceae bacterium]